MASFRTRVVVTNGELGTDNTCFIGEFAIYSPQGRAAIKRHTQAMAERHGRVAWALTYGRWDKAHTAKTPPNDTLAVAFPARLGVN